MADHRLQAVAACEKEIVELHEFFVMWFAGKLPDEAFDAFLSRFSDDFEMVNPGGAVVTKADLGDMRAAKGSNAEWSIYIDNVRLQVVPTGGERSQIVTGTYWELQQGARGSATTNGRISTPLFELDASVQPNGVRWLRLHETWLPEATLEAFDWESRAAVAAASFIDKLALICVQDRKQLVARAKGKTAFFTPGGKREAGESDVQALVRECKEELTVDLVQETIAPYGVFQAQAFGKPEGVMVRMTCYTAEFAGTLQPNEEIEELRWIASDCPESDLTATGLMILADLRGKDLID